MISLSCILLLIERGDPVHQSLNKALMLARHCRARLDLFLCDSEQLPLSKPGSAAEAARREAARVARALEYVRALYKSVASTDIDITQEVSCGRPAGEALAQRLERTGAKLVIKAIRKDSAPFPDLLRTDWPLIGDCRVPIMLTSGRVWRPVPRFAAAVDLQESRGEASGGAVVDLGEALAEFCGAELDLVSAGALPQPPVDVVSLGLREAANPKGRAGRHRHYLAGEPREVLGCFLKKENYDLLVIGKPHHQAWMGLRAGVARELIEASEGDVVFVPDMSAGGRQVTDAVQSAH